MEYATTLSLITRLGAEDRRCSQPENTVADSYEPDLNFNLSVAGTSRHDASELASSVSFFVRSINAQYQCKHAHEENGGIHYLRCVMCCQASTGHASLCTASGATAIALTHLSSDTEPAEPALLCMASAATTSASAKKMGPICSAASAHVPSPSIPSTKLRDLALIELPMTICDITLRTKIDSKPVYDHMLGHHKLMPSHEHSEIHSTDYATTDYSMDYMDFCGMCDVASQASDRYLWLPAVHRLHCKRGKYSMECRRCHMRSPMLDTKEQGLLFLDQHVPSCGVGMREFEVGVGNAEADESYAYSDDENYQSMLLMESLKVNIADGTNAYNRHKFFFIEGEGWSVACGMCIFSAGTLVEVIIDMDTNTLTVDSSNFYTHRKSCCGGKASLVSFQERITAAQESLNRFFPCPKSAHKIENEPVDLSTEKERVTKLRFAMQCGVQGCGKLVTLFRLDKNQCWGCPFKIVLSNGIKHLEWHRNHTDPLSKTARDRARKALPANALLHVASCEGGPVTRGPYKTGSRLAGKTKGKSVSFQLQENSTFGVPDRTTQWDDALQAGEDPSWLLGQNKSEENMSWFSQAYDHDFNRAKQYKMAIGDYYASDLYTADDREVCQEVLEGMVDFLADKEEVYQVCQDMVGEWIDRMFAQEDKKRQVDIIPTTEEMCQDVLSELIAGVFAQEEKRVQAQAAKAQEEVENVRKLALHKSVFSLCTMLMEKSSSASKKSSIAQLIYTRLSAGTQQVWSAEAIRKLVFSTQSPAKWNKKTVENVEEALQVLRELTVV